MELTLNEQLKIAFYQSRFSLCHELIVQGADRNIILSAAKNIKPFNRTMSQDLIINELAGGAE